ESKERPCQLRRCNPRWGEAARRRTLARRLGTRQFARAVLVAVAILLALYVLSRMRLVGGLMGGVGVRGDRAGGGRGPTGPPAGSAAAGESPGLPGDSPRPVCARPGPRAADRPRRAAAATATNQPGQRTAPPIDR